MFWMSMPGRYGLLACVAAAVLASAWLANTELAAAFESGKGLTVDRIYDDPSLSGSSPTRLRWAPDGKSVTYLDDASEQEDPPQALWRMEVPSGKKKLLLTEEELVFEDTEVSLSRYVWDDQGKALLLASKGDLFLYRLKEKDLLRLTETDAMESDAKLSPDGSRVAFVRDHDLYSIDIASGEEFRLTEDGGETILNGELDWVYEEEFSLSTGYWWSPDGTYIAFLRFDETGVTRFPLTDFLPVHNEVEWQHYPKAGDDNPVVTVGVVDVAKGSTAWLDTGDDADTYVARVDWVSHGPLVAVQHLNREQDHLRLLFGDPETGATRVVLEEKAETFVNIRDQHFFFEEREAFLWSSERDGWQHLYLYDLEGNELERLTQGEWMVTSLAGVDEKRGRIYFSATEKSPRERHLYRVELGGGGFERLSEAEGTHSMTLSPEGKNYIGRHSSYRHPTKTGIYRSDGKREFWIEENVVEELEDYALSLPEPVTFTGEDGTLFHGEITKPALFTPGEKYPVIVYVYGGPHAQVVRNRWGGSRFLWHQMMAQKGFVIFSMDNRGSFARGKVFEDALYRIMGQVEVADQLQGVEYLKTLPYVDPDRIGVWGWSYGGYMTLLCLMKGGEAFQAGVSVAPVADWRDYDTIYTERYMDRPQDNGEGYEIGSPVTHVDKLAAPLLLVHGTGDDNVHFANSVQLVDKLIGAGKPFELMIYPGRLHGIHDDPARIHLFERMTEFFLENLQ